MLRGGWMLTWGLACHAKTCKTLLEQLPQKLRGRISALPILSHPELPLTNTTHSHESPIHSYAHSFRMEGSVDRGDLRMLREFQGRGPDPDWTSPGVFWVSDAPVKHRRELAMWAWRTWEMLAVPGAQCGLEEGSRESQGPDHGEHSTPCNELCFIRSSGEPPSG